MSERAAPDPGHFDRVAEVYDRGRPPYPDALWEHLTSTGLLGPGVRVLELGAGTGIATGAMLAAGATVTAVEPGAELVRVLRRRHPDAAVRQVPAEEVDPAPASFDLAAVATAVHWFDLDVVLPMLHRALVPGGHLAVWRNSYGDGAAEVTPFRARIDEIVRRRGEEPRVDGGDEETRIWVPRLEAGGLFRAVDTRIIRWSIDLDADRIHDLFESFSNWTEAEADEAADAARELGGTVTEHYLTGLIVLRRMDDAS